MVVWERVQRTRGAASRLENAGYRKRRVKTPACRGVGCQDGGCCPQNLGGICGWGCYLSEKRSGRGFALIIIVLSELGWPVGLGLGGCCRIGLKKTGVWLVNTVAVN